ncbi:hypothetical protein HK102_003132, partial [Quaeritorhiza haematococci]
MGNGKAFCRARAPPRGRGPANTPAIVVVAEGARYLDADPPVLDAEAFGHPRTGGIGALIADVIDRQLRVETRTVVLGHLQRGGAPTAHDRVLATRMGLAAAELVLRRRFGTVLTLRGSQIAEVPLDSAALAPRSLAL